MSYYNYTGNQKIDDVLNHPDLDFFIDVPLLYNALAQPENIKLIPKNNYEFLLKFLEELEEYELFARFVKIKDKTDNRPLQDIFEEWDSLKE